MRQHAARPCGKCWSRRRLSNGACRSREVEAVNHEVVHQASGRRLGYGELAKAGMPSCRCRPSSSLKLKDPAEFRYIGKGEIPI